MSHNNHTLVDQDVEYYHVHRCACGAEVFHDGATTTCEDSYFDTYQCAGCKPYLFEDLLTRGQILSAKPHNLMETVCILTIGWICGLISCGAIWLILR